MLPLCGRVATAQHEMYNFATEIGPSREANQVIDVKTPSERSVLCFHLYGPQVRPCQLVHWFSVERMRQGSQRHLEQKVTAVMGTAGAKSLWLWLRASRNLPI